MGGSLQPGRREPPSLQLWIMRETQYLIEGLSKVNTGTREISGQVCEASDSVFTRGTVADMENHSVRKTRGRVFPVALHRAVLATPNNHVCNVLRVGNITRRK
jgi:hypothetical protein